jgi:hypothetical protein
VKWHGKIPLPEREREPSPKLCPKCNGRLYRGSHPGTSPWVLHLNCNGCGVSVTYDSREGITTISKLEVVRR